MTAIGLDVPRSGIAHTWAEARSIGDEIGLPLIIRPSRTLGGTGGGIATTGEEFERAFAKRASSCRRSTRSSSRNRSPAGRSSSSR
jgi:carbamoylphosphate synthase large subunit